MKSFSKLSALLAAIFALGLLATGCKEKTPEEKAADAMSDAAKKTGDAAKDASKAAEDAAKKAQDAMKK